MAPGAFCLTLPPLTSTTGVSNKQTNKQTKFYKQLLLLSDNSCGGMGCASLIGGRGRKGRSSGREDEEKREGEGEMRREEWKEEWRGDERRGDVREEREGRKVEEKTREEECGEEKW